MRIDFTLAAAADVTLWTDSWLAGLDFDPTLALFDAGLDLLTIGDDVGDPSQLLPGQGGYYSRIGLPMLAAGHYLLALTASGNDALGPDFLAGFSLPGTTPILIAEWNRPSYDINADDQKGSAWRVHLDGVSAVSPVPEPGEWVLMSLGLFVVGAWGSRQRRRPTRSAAAAAAAADAPWVEARA